MKTMGSFFPTNTNPKEPSRHQVFHLISKHNRNPLKRSQHHQWINHSCQNIFGADAKDILRTQMAESKQERPVGGVQLFKKMEKIVKEGGMGDRRAGRRVNKDTTMREIHTSFAEQKHREQQAEAGLKLVEAWAITRPIQFNRDEELFKEHSTYSGGTAKQGKKFRNSTSTQKNITHMKSQNSCIERPSTANHTNTAPFGSSVRTRATRNSKWVDTQLDQYLTKVALLNQITYNQPLVQLYGQRYFEFILRDRHKEEHHPAPYIYQVQDKLCNTRVIDRIRRAKPELMERRKLIVKGNHINDKHKINLEQGDS